MKVTYKMNLPMGMIKKGQKKETQKKIIRIIEENTFDRIAELRSPVTGQNFKALSKKYAEKKGKKTIPVPNLELSSKMLKSYDSEMTTRSIEVGIFDEKQALKADNHNKFSAKSRKTPVPPRKFIPNKKEGERYPNQLLNKVADAIKESSDSPKSEILSALKDRN